MKSEEALRSFSEGGFRTAFVSGCPGQQRGKLYWVAANGRVKVNVLPFPTSEVIQIRP